MKAKINKPRVASTTGAFISNIIMICFTFLGLVATIAAEGNFHDVNVEKLFKAECAKYDVCGESLKRDEMSSDMQLRYYQLSKVAILFKSVEF